MSVARVLLDELGDGGVVVTEPIIPVDSFDFNDKGKSFGIFDDLKKRGLSPYAIARSVGRNLGSSDRQGQQVRIRIKLD